MHMNKIAQEHKETKFVRIDAEKCPFFVSKLNIQMLPTIICFCDGIAVDRICGFDELGGTDDFPTIVMTRALIATGCLMAKTRQERGEMKVKKGNRRHDSDADLSD